MAQSCRCCRCLCPQRHCQHHPQHQPLPLPASRVLHRGSCRALQQSSSSSSRRMRSSSSSHVMQLATGGRSARRRRRPWERTRHALQDPPPALAPAAAARRPSKARQQGPIPLAWQLLSLARPPVPLLPWTRCTSWWPAATPLGVSGGGVRWAGWVGVGQCWEGRHGGVSPRCDRSRPEALLNLEIK